MRKIIGVLLAGLLLCSAAGCSADTAQPDGGIAVTNVPADLMTDEALVDRVLYLFDGYVLPVYWWHFACTFSLGVNEYVEPLEDTPEGTEFYPVTRFSSMEELKRATEQVVTRDYAETYLYSVYEEYHQFIERDGKLYTNMAIRAGGAAWKAVSATVLSKSENNALMSVVFEDFYGNQEVYDIELIRENGIWKLNDFPYLN